MDVRRWRKGFFLALISLLLSNSPSANSSTCSIQLVGNSTTGALLGSAQGVADCQCWEEYGYGRGAIIEYPYLNSELSDLCDMAGFPGGLFGYSDNSNDAVAVRPWWRSAQPNATTLKFSGSLITLDGEGSQVPTAANLDLTANGPFMPLLYFSRVTNLTLRNLVFRNLTASGPLILLEGCSNVTLQNVTFEDVRFVAGSSTAGLIRAVRLSYSDASSAAAATTAAGAGPDAPLSDVVMRGITARRISVASSGRSTTTTTTSNSAHVTLSGCSNGCALEHMAFEDMELDASWAAALAVSDLSSASLSNVRLSKITSAGSSCGISISNTSNVRAANTTAKGFSSGSNNLQASALCARQSVDLVLNGYSCSGCSSRQGPCLNTALSSISLSGGNFTGNTATVGGSGGALCLLGNVAGSSAALQLSNCTFAGNTAGSGGAIAVVPSNGASLSLDISSSTFVKNTAYMYGTEPAFGGDIYSVDDSSLVVSSSSFVGSTAADGGSNGGSIYARRSRAAVSGSNFTGCTSLNRGGAIYHEPVAKYCPSPDSCSLSLDACRFENNSADEGGAVVFLLLENTISGFNVSSSTFLSNSAGNVGGAISMPGNCEPYVNDACKVQADPKRQALSRLRSCRFEGNSALTGGAVYYAYNNAQGLSITSTEFVGNSAKEHGGLHIRAVPAVEISDTLFANNTATLIGAASLYSLHSHALINNATFRNNSCNQGESGTGSALYVAEYDGVTSNGTQDGEVFTLTLSNSTFEDNFSSSEAGGASITRCNALLEDVSFRNNAAARKGGALYLEPDVGGVLVAAMDSVKRRVTDATLRRVRFRDNRATTNAGALLVSGWRLQMEDVSFVNNSANTFAAGGSDNAGGAMMATNCPATLELRNVSFSQNRAYQGGALIAEVCNMTLRNANFSSNTARGDAGAVLVTGFTSKDFTADSSPYALNLVDTAFEKNIASGVGGALKAYWAVVSAAGTVFNNNKASIQGGAVYLQIVPPMPHTDNGAAVDTGVRAVFDRCEFLSNAVNNSGGALFHAASAVHLSDCKLYDNSAGNGFISDSWSNAGGAIFGMSCTAPMRLAGGELSGNRADGRGGAVALLSCAASLEGSDMYGNIAKLSGGGVSAGHQVTSAQPEGPELSITNCTLRSNTAADEHGGSVHTTSVPLSLRGSRLAASTAKQMGGAVFSSAAEYITVSDCILEDNHAGGSGGGLRVEGASLVMVNGSTAKGNSAFETGGGLDLLNTACSYISGVVLEDNTAASGGGARMAMPALTGQSLAATGLSCQAAFSQQVGEEWAARLSRVSERIVEQQGEAVVLVAANLVATNNQALRGVGGTLLLETTRGSIILDALRAGGNIAASTGAAVAFINTVAEDAALYVMSSWLYDNKAAGIGGAISMDGSWSQQQMFISNTTFQRNRAASGGAVSLTRNASLALQDCTLEDNTAAGSSAGDSGDGSGGSLYGESCNWMMLKDTTIRTSSAVRGHGGGLYCSGCGGVVLHNASLVLNDAAGSGGAAYVDASTATGPSLVEVLGGTMRLNTAGSNGSSTAVASDGNLLSGSGGALYLGGRLAAVLNGSRLVGNTAARAAGALALDLRFRQDTSGSSDVVSSSPRLFPLLGSSSIASSSLTSPAASLAVSMSSLRPGLAEIAAASALTLQALAGAVGRSVASDCWPIVINRPALWNNTAGGSGGALYSSSAYTLALLCDGVQTSGSDSDLAWMVNAITSNSSPGTVPAGAVQLATTATGSISSSTGDSDTSNNAGSNTTSDLYLGMLPTSQEARTKCFVPQQDQEFYAERVPPNQARGGYGNEMATTPKMLILSALAEYERTALTSYSANKIKVVDSSDPTRIVVYSRLLLQATTQDREGGYANTSATATTAVFNPPPSLPPAASASSSSVASSTSTGSTAVAVSSEDFVWLRRAVLQVDGHLAEECRPGQRCAVVLPTNVAVALDISVYDALTQLVNDSSTVQPVVRVSVSSSDAGRPVDLLGNPTAQVDGGIATLTGIRLRALKGEYSLQLGLSNMETEVDPLVLNVTVPPCSLGEVAMDSGFFCSRCPANLLSLDVDYFTNASGGGAAIGLFGEAANTSDTGTSTDGRCFACPDNANCTGGAVVAPVPGYWHSAANSTAMHACLNPAACRYGDITANAALVRCQERWYAYFGNPWRLYALMSDGNGGADVVGAYINVFRQAASNATSVQPYTPLISNSSSDFDGFLLDCALWGLPDNDSASYMQMQCAPGYTGILCATCTDYDESRYALDSDFRCNPCYSKWLTILVGVAVFIANTLWLSFSAIMTHMTDYSKQMQKQGAQRSVRRSVKDLITGRISNGTIYYPGEEERRGKKGLAAADILKVLIVHFQFFLIVTRINLNWPDSVTGLQSVVGSITGTVKQVYSPSCLLRPGSDSAEQARMQVLPGLLLPACSVLLVLVLWFLRARFWMSGKHAPSSVDGEPRIWGTLSLKRSIESQPSLKDDAAVRGPRETEGSEGGAPAVERPTGHHGRKGLKDAGSAVAANTRKIYFANERERIRQGPEGSSGKATAGAAAAAADEFPVIEGDGMAIVQTAATVANRGARGTRRALSSKPYGLGAGPRDVRSLLAGTTSLTATTAEALAHVEVLMDQPVNPLFGSRASVVTSSPRASLAVVAAAAMRRLSSVARNRTRELWRPLAPATSGSISTAPGPVAEGTSPPLQPATSNRHPNPLYNERTTPALEGTLSAACSICPEIVDILEYNTGDGKQEPYDNEAAVIPAARWWQPRRLSRGGSLAGCRSSITSNIYSSSVGSTEKPGAGKGHAIGQSVDAARSNGAAVQQDTSAAKGIGSGPEKGARRRSQRLIAVGASSKALVGAAGGKASFRRKKPTAVQPVSVGGPDEGKLPLGKQLFLVLMVTCFIMMPNWATEALSIFACYRLDDGQVGSGMSESYVQFQRATWKYGYWIRDMNQQCYAGQHLTLWVPIGVVSVVLLCLTMPLLTAGLLFANRKQLMTQPQVRQLYGFLFSSYHDKFYYWESLSQAQTLVLVVVEVFGRTLPVYQQALLLEIILLAILLLNTYFSPLRAAELNLMQLLSLAVICMTVTLGMFTSSPVDNVSEASDIILGVVILLINCLIILAFLALFIYHALPTVKRKATRLITRLGYDPAHLEQSLSRALTNLSPSRAWSSLSMPRAWTSLSHTRSRGRDIGLPVQFEDDGIGGGGDTGEAVDNGRNGGVGGHGSNAV